jgi:hypothetical protein
MSRSGVRRIRPKYGIESWVCRRGERAGIASTTLSDPQWADTIVLSGDLAVAISELKAKPGELQVHGSGAVTRWLLENDLVDETNLLICPCRGPGLLHRQRARHGSRRQEAERRHVQD